MGLAAAPADVLDAVESRRQASMERLQHIFGPDGAISDLNQAGAPCFSTTLLISPQFTIVCYVFAMQIGKSGHLKNKEWAVLSNRAQHLSA